MQSLTYINAYVSVLSEVYELEAFSIQEFYVQELESSEILSALQSQMRKVITPNLPEHEHDVTIVTRAFTRQPFCRRAQGLHVLTEFTVSSLGLTIISRFSSAFLSRKIIHSSSYPTCDLYLFLELYRYYSLPAIFPLITLSSVPCRKSARNCIYFPLC